MNPPNDSPEESTMSKNRDDRLAFEDGDWEAAYGDFVTERGSRVVEAEDGEWHGDPSSRAERITSRAREAQTIAAKRAR